MVDSNDEPMINKPRQPVSMEQWIAFAAIMVIALAVRLYGLDAQSLWFDEVYTYLSSKDGFGAIVFDPFDVNLPPLYYLLINAVLEFGRSEFALRLPSVVFGALSILIIWDITRKDFDNPTAMLAALLLALSPFHVWYSQEARPYMLLLFLAVLAIWFYREAARAPDRRVLAIGFVGATVLACYTHLVGLALPGLFLVHLALVHNGTKRRALLRNLAWVVVLVAPVLLRSYLIPPDSPADASQEFAPVSFLLYTIWAFAAGYSMGPSLTSLHMPNRIDLILNDLPQVILFGTVTVGLFLLGIVRMLQKTQLRFQLLWLAIPIAFSLAGAMLTDHGFNVRYTIIAFPVFIAGMASGVMYFRSDQLRVAALGLAVLASSLALINYHFDEKYHRENTRAAASYLERNMQPGDLTIVSSAYTQQSVKFYLSAPDGMQIVGYPRGDRMISASSNPSESPRTVDLQQLAADLTELVIGKRRFWLFLSRTFDSDPSGQIVRYFDAHFERADTKSWAGAVLILYSAGEPIDATPAIPTETVEARLINPLMTSFATSIQHAP